VHGLSREGRQVRASGEELAYREEFDTVLVVNVLDHVRAPDRVLDRCWRALRPGGTLVVAVDCLSAVGKLRFDLVTRWTHRGAILVDAHPTRSPSTASSGC
jgi:SAM-dependent methyltransferase